MVTRKDYSVGLNTTANTVDDPDQQFYENYACGSQNNVTKYCNPELDKLFDQQSMEADPEKRKRMVWEIDKKLQEDGARPIIYHLLSGTCWQPQVRGLTIMVNSISNGWRARAVREVLTGRIPVPPTASHVAGCRLTENGSTSNCRRSRHPARGDKTLAEGRRRTSAIGQGV
jgi:hypothetical protein